MDDSDYEDADAFEYGDFTTMAPPRPVARAHPPRRAPNPVAASLFSRINRELVYTDRDDDYDAIRRFDEYFRVYSMALAPKANARELNLAGKIILPQSALAKLSSLHIAYPMIFCLTPADGPDPMAGAGAGSTIDPLNPPPVTHAGVIEFIAEEGRVYVPDAIIRRLGLALNSLIRVRSTTLPLGTFIRIQPQSVAFLDISDPRAVLEMALRGFGTLTPGDIVAFNYNGREYQVRVLETKPMNVNVVGGVSVIETDLSVEFAAPVGYVEPQNASPGDSRPGSVVSVKPPPAVLVPATKEKESWQVFAGTGQRLGAKSNTAHAPSTALSSETVDEEEKDANEIPAVLDLPWNRLFFGYAFISPIATVADSEEPASVSNKPVFSGQGVTLRQAKKQGQAEGESH